MLSAAFLVAAIAQVSEFETRYGEYQIKGFEGEGTGLPVYVWITGTTMDSWNGDAQRYTEYMAGKGYVAGSVFYNSGVYPLSCDGFRGKAESLFNATNPNSALYALCSLPKADCTKGVVVSGFSQGAQLTSLAANYAGPHLITAIYESAGGDRIQPPGVPAYAQCMNKEHLVIPTERIRSMVGVSDATFGGSYENIRKQQVAITGIDCANQYNCLSAAGYGWYIIQDDQPSSQLANHCYAYENGCDSYNFDHNYATTAEDWGFHANLNWLDQMVRAKNLKKSA